jgi:hypothetical protein
MDSKLIKIGAFSLILQEIICEAGFLVITFNFSMNGFDESSIL